MLTSSSCPAWPSTGSAGGWQIDPAERPLYTGIIPDTARKRDDFLYSHHPLYGIAARGPLAEELVRMNDRTMFPSAERKFIYRMMRSGGKSLLLGVTHEANSTIHLIEEFAGLEYKVQDKRWWPMTVEEFRRLPEASQEEALARHGGRHLPYDLRGNFNAIDLPLRRAGLIRIGPVGAAESRLMRQIDVVETGLCEVSRNPGFLKTRIEKR